MGNTRTVHKTRRFMRDLDQIKADVKSPKHLTLYKATKATEDLPALGQFYCIECSKWFEQEHNIAAHRRGKVHKRRVRALKADAHSQKVADAAVGLSIDNGKPSTTDRIVEDENMDTVT